MPSPASVASTTSAVFDTASVTVNVSSFSTTPPSPMVATANVFVSPRLPAKSIGVAFSL